MSDGRLFSELEEICMGNYDEMQRTLDTLQDMLNNRIDAEDQNVIE